jgi:hypothetical protein
MEGEGSISVEYSKTKAPFMCLNNKIAAKLEAIYKILIENQHFS